MFISFICSKSLISALVSFPSLLVLWIFCFISLWVAFTSSLILWPMSIHFVSILITSVLNSASDRLSISSSLSSFYGVLICSFIWALFLVSVYLWRYKLGRGQRRNNAAPLLCSSPTFQWTLLWDWEFLPSSQPPKCFIASFEPLVSRSASPASPALSTPCCSPSLLGCLSSLYAPHTNLGPCFFSSLVVRVPCSLIFWHFWLFIVFKLVVFFFWLYKEARCFYLHLHLGQKSVFLLQCFPNIDSNTRTRYVCESNYCPQQYKLWFKF